MDFKDYIMSERVFLHDISNQIVVIQASANFLKKSLELDEGRLSEKEELKLSRLNSSVAKLIASLKERKDLVSQFKEFSEST